MVRSRRFTRGFPWIVAVCALGLGAGLPLALVAWLTAEPAEMRIVATGNDLSALVVDGGARVLVINATDRELAGEALGIMARPWERGPNVLIAPADDRAATGLWESLTRTQPSNVIIVGIPGAASIWAAIEDVCRERDIDLRFVTGTLTFDTERLTVTVFGPQPGGEGPMAIVVRHEEVNAVLLLSSAAPAIEAQVAIANADPGIEGLSVLVSARAVAVGAGIRQLIAAEREIIHMRFEDAHVRIEGGTLLDEVVAQPTEAGEQE